ncbi:MAG: GxxExxY protein [Sedimentisphaerales bacterium]|jgi:GxxExxY protein
MSTNNIVHKELSYKIVGCAMEVHSQLGSGFLEKVYENALMVLFRKEGIAARQQTPIKVNFEGELVGEYYADILVDEKIILELKTADKIVDIHRAQILHYLTATGIKLGMILNFGSKSFEYERLVV